MNSETVFTEKTCTVAIVGGGTAGLAVASQLKRLSIEKVVVIEREDEVGGVPRNCDHYPFGLREHSRFLKGSAYAKRNKKLAKELGVELLTNTTVTKIRPNATLELLSKTERILLKADRVVLTTGVRESSRSQRLIGGDRPNGVITTGALQKMVYMSRFKPFQRPIIIGSELVSFSAIQTCAHLGIKPVAMIEEQDQVRVRKLFRPYLFIKNIPLYLSVSNIRINGHTSVESIKFKNSRGLEHEIETDGVIISGRFRPETQLLLDSHIEIDAGTSGPAIDQHGRCTDTSFYATGNILGHAESSGFCWHEGIETAKRIHEDLLGKGFSDNYMSQVRCDDPAVKFLIPQNLSSPHGSMSMGRFYIGLNSPINREIVIKTNLGVIWKGKIKSRPLRRLQIPIPNLP